MLKLILQVPVTGTVKMPEMRQNIYKRVSDCNSYFTRVDVQRRHVHICVGEEDAVVVDDVVV